MNKHELLQFNHSNIQDLIKFIDQKAGALLIIYGFLFTATIEFAKDLEFINPFMLNEPIKSLFSIITFISGLAIIILLIYQIYIVLFEIIKPRGAKNYTQEEQSIIYFDHISKRSKTEFLSYFNQISDDDFGEIIEKELIQQVYEISCIMKSKSEKFNEVLKFLFISVFLLLTFILFSRLV